MRIMYAVAAACALAASALQPARAASPADAQYFLGTWTCGETQWRYEPLTSASTWTGVSYGDPSHPAGTAVLGYVAPQNAWIYRDFHTDGGYAELSSSGIAAGKLVWSGQYYPADGSAAMTARVTYTIVDAGHFKRTFETEQAGAFVARGADACVKSTPQALDAAPWIAVDVGGQAVNVPADAKSPALRFDAAEHRVSGSTGCNNLTGSYTQTGAALTFSPPATTRMMCPEPFAALETRFLAAMTKTASYTIDGSTLTLRSSAGETLATFKAAR
jgi:heat shock protein HslJ